VIFGRPVYAAVFLIINGLILLAGERFRRRASLDAEAQIAAEREYALAGGGGGYARSYQGRARHAASHDLRLEEMDNAVESDERLSRMGFGEAVIIGSAQVLALLAGISRDGVTMVAGMARGLSREDAARFAFLLATPVILAAGALKIPDLMGPLGNGIHGQVVVGSVLSGVGAYVSVKYLVRYFQTRTLIPFAIYCIVAGFAGIAYLYLVR
jgi:undecaprenyl-diphosphatase